jgi:hypothetical protein
MEKDGQAKILPPIRFARPSMPMALTVYAN